MGLLQKKVMAIIVTFFSGFVVKKASPSSMVVVL
jgi:hypothetical protein